MSKTLGMLLGATLALSASAPSHASELHPWRQHAAPFDFLFGNEIDTHQQTRRARDGRLWGFFYVKHTGVVTQDGWPVATHVDCIDIASHLNILAAAP